MTGPTPPAPAATTDHPAPSREPGGRTAARPDPLAELNPAQREAATHGLGDADAAGEGPPRPGPLLVVAGAGSGKTKTLAHRVAELVLAGVDPGRILLLTFSRRAAREMSRRAEAIVLQASRSPRAAASPRRSGARGPHALRWAGTFHGVGNRLLRHHAAAVGLDPGFTVLDRSDAADLLDLERHELGLSGRARRFPQKATCLRIYSRTVNARAELAETLEAFFPWCRDWEEELRALFRAYVEAKLARHVLDYDDLLLYLGHLLAEPALAAEVRRRFDHVLVDEYQDTNALQASILLALAPDGRGLTVVGDDAQAIYGFRGATVRNILDFPAQFRPRAAVITLEESYRSTRPILDAANAVIGLAARRYRKELHSSRDSALLPRLVSVEDELAQATYVADRVLAAREEGLRLREQGVLFRTAHHSDALELELARRGVPYVVFGGLRFLEAAHVKDFLCVLRWAENPRDGIAAFRALQLLPGVGPATARRALAAVDGAGGDHRALSRFEPPAAAARDWPGLAALLASLTDGSSAWPGQAELVRTWYEPHLERLYEAPGLRAGDLDQLALVAGDAPSRERFLSDLALDPPSATGDLAGDPHLDEDYLVLSTIHSAKGQEWNAVFVLNVCDGCIPSDMATGSPEQVEEERRLLYVAMTRARDELHLVHPLRFYSHRQRRHGDGHVYAPSSRFLPPEIRDRFEVVREAPRHGAGPAPAGEAAGVTAPTRVDVAARLRRMW